MEFLTVFLRSVFAFFFILAIARILGKTQVSQLTFWDYVVGITIGSTASTMAVDLQTSIFENGLVILVFAVLTLLINKIVLVNIPARKILEGEPIVVIKNGKIMENALKRADYTVDQMLMQLRDNNIFNVEDVEFAVLENNGSLSVQTKSQKRNLTPEDLNIDTEYEGMPVNLIVDGNIVYHRLKELSLTKAWLLDKLKKQGITDVNEVLLAQLDTSGNLYVDQKNDWPQ